MNNSGYQKGFSVYKKYYKSHLAPFVKSKQATAYMMIILSLFTTSFFGIFAIRPTLNTIVELNRQIQDSQAVNEALQKKIDALVKAQEEYQLIKKFVPEIDEALPNKPNVGNLINKLTDLSNEQEATISGLDVGVIVYKKNDSSEEEVTNESSTDTTTIPINLHLNGTYSEFSSFLNRLFKMRRTVTSNNLDITIGAIDQIPTLNLGLELNTYYLEK